MYTISPPMLIMSIGMQKEDIELAGGAQRAGGGGGAAAARCALRAGKLGAQMYLPPMYCCIDKERHTGENTVAGRTHTHGTNIRTHTQHPGVR